MTGDNINWSLSLYLSTVSWRVKLKFYAPTPALFGNSAQYPWSQRKYATNILVPSSSWRPRPCISMKCRNIVLQVLGHLLWREVSPGLCFVRNDSLINCI